MRRVAEWIWGSDCANDAAQQFLDGRRVDTARHDVKRESGKNSFILRIFTYYLAERLTRRARIPARYQRITALPQVNPEPKAVMETTLPSLRSPCSSASARSIGIEAAEQFP